MKTQLILLLVPAMVLLLASAGQAQKMMCVSQPELRGEETVSSCLSRGERFGVFDANNLAKVLTPEEAELSQAFNPKAFATRAFGIKHLGEAPQIPPLPVSPEQQ